MRLEHGAIAEISLLIISWVNSPPGTENGYRGCLTLVSFGIPMDLIDAWGLTVENIPDLFKASLRTFSAAAILSSS